MPYGISIPTLWYNAEILRQAGLDRPAPTWAELRTQARQIAERTGKVGFYIGESTSFVSHQGLVESNGARTIVGSGNDVRCGVDSPEAIEAMQLAADMVIKDKAAAHLPQSQGFTSFKSGQIGMVLSYSSTHEDFRKGSSFTLGSGVQPSFGAKPRRLPVGGNVLYVFATDLQQQAAAWEAIKYLHSPEALTIWVRGTGYLSPRSGLADDPRHLKPFFEENPLLRPALDQVPEIVPWFSFPGRNGVEADKELLDAREKILSGQEVAATLRDAVARVNRLVKE